jgi:hypothetical protein
MRCYSHLSDDEREQIGLLKALGQAKMLDLTGADQLPVARGLPRHRK